MRDNIQYLKYVIRHKYFVYKAARKLGLGFWQALVHDVSKFLPSEWKPYVNTFYNKDGSKKAYYQTTEFAAAWNHHQKRNKHHWQYWLLTWDNGTTQALQMPDKYAKEMLADWVGAGRAITGKIEVKEWYTKNKEKIQLDFRTKAFVEMLMDKYFVYEEKSINNKEPLL